MTQDQRTRRGYLLLADISGYTAFLAGTELEHANATCSCFGRGMGATSLGAVR